MKKRIGLYLYLSSLLLALTLVISCASSDDTEIRPITPPADSSPQSSTSLSATELVAVDEFVTQQQAIDLEWDQFHKDFDRWRAALNLCGETAIQDSLRDFAVSFNLVTEQARDLPRASATRGFADTIIEAAESEEAAFRQLYDRWQPNSPSLFEMIEQQRTESARAQRKVQDLVMDLQEKLEKVTDPGGLQSIEELSFALEPVSDAWDEFHDDYTSLLQEAAGLDNQAVLARLNRLIEKLNSVLQSIDGLPTTYATENMVEALQGAAEAEQTALANTHNAVTQAIMASSEMGDEPATPGTAASGQTVAPLLKALETAIKDSRAALKEADLTIEDALKEVDLTIEDALDGSATQDLQDVQEFADKYQVLLSDWGAFHEQYNNWRRTEGGCNRTEVLEALGQFNIRMTEISRQVRDLPQSGYLLPMYNLLVEAAEREEGAIRALRNSWQPFTVDAFIAAERERDNADRLRREASIALDELRNRS